MSWKKYKVDEFAVVVGGGTPSTKNPSYWDGNISWITPKDLSDYNNRFIERGERNITEDGLSSSSAKLVPANTVLLTTRAPVGYVAIAKCPVSTNQGFKNLECNPEKADYSFVYYLLKLNTELLESHATGSTFKELSANRLRSIEFNLPLVPTQQNIAATLSTYDDLIENNLRRIELLESAALLIYKEWFVKLNFPGREHTKIIDGVPKGWERVALAELCESISYGFTASAQKENVGPKFLRITDIVPFIIDWSAVPHCEIPENRKGHYLLEEGDIVIARTGATTGYAKRMHKRIPESVFASYLIRLRLKKSVDDCMIGVFVESDEYKKYVTSQMSGAAQPGANAKVLSAVKILLPLQQLQKMFRDVVEPMLDQKEILQLENDKLRKARDILLPKLMTGEIAA